MGIVCRLPCSIHHDCSSLSASPGVVCLLTDARPPKKERVKQRRENWVVKSFRNETHTPLKQGECLEGWYDSSEVGLGCILPDLTDRDIDEPSSETVCSQFGEGGQLVEIFNYDQMHFLRNMIAIIESDNHLDGDAYWWIGLTDHAEEGTWVWPSGMAANFTWWNEDYGEPYPDTEDYEYDCAQMLSSEWDALKWMAYSCDDAYSTYPVCQLP